MDTADFPTLATGTIVLRRFDPEDLDGYTLLLQDPETFPYITEQGPVATSDVPAKLQRARESYQTGTHLYWAVALAESNEFVGYIAAHNLAGNPVSLSYATLPERRRRGFMAAAVRAVMRFLFERGAPVLEARVHLGNLASERLLETVGFRRTNERDGRTVFVAERRADLD